VTLRPIEIEGHLALEDRWNLLHRHPLGRAGETFARGLDRGVLVGARCPACGRTLLPPRSFCERCFEATELVDIESGEGELLAFTIVRHGFDGSPDVPYAIAYVRMDGADTALGALLEGFDPAEPDGGLRIGQRVAVTIAATGFGIERVRYRPLP
jgi:uncharacterized OB-fold protein